MKETAVVETNSGFSTTMVAMLGSVLQTTQPAVLGFMAHGVAVMARVDVAASKKIN
jgi:hypothetical protein